MSVATYQPQPQTDVLALACCNLEMASPDRVRDAQGGSICWLFTQTGDSASLCGRSTSASSQLSRTWPLPSARRAQMSNPLSLEYTWYTWLLVARTVL